MPEPSSRQALIAIDLGAESCRVSLLRFLDVPHIQLVHRFPNGAIESPSGLHWDLNRILSGIHHGLEQCASIATEGIRSIGVDGWAVDYVRLDAQERLAAPPFCYRDDRTLASQSAAEKMISAERMRDLTAIDIQRLNTVYQLLADPPEFHRLSWLNIPEYVLHQLGARPVAERTNASHTQLLGTDGKWCDEILAALDLNQTPMPELVSPGTEIGRLAGPLARLPAFANTRLIAPACHDTASAVAAVPDTSDDWAYISSGTWSLVGTTLSTPNNSCWARSENFTNLIGADNKICFHKSMSGMWLLRQCLEAWQSQGHTLDIATLIDEAAAQPNPALLLDVGDPDLFHAGKMPDRINAQLRHRALPEIDASVDGAPRLASLVFHSLAAAYAATISGIASITGKQFQRIYVMGGGSRNQLLNQLTSRATGLPVIPIGAECSTVGNFAVQLTVLEPEQSLSQWAAALQPLPEALDRSL